IIPNGRSIFLKKEKLNLPSKRKFILSYDLLKNHEFSKLFNFKVFKNDFARISGVTPLSTEFISAIISLVVS
ncbi:MAG: hypothetical protein ACUVUG_08260, partial [Candidatus Aminicenantia bacterium]